MSILCLQPTHDVYHQLYEQALACGELWNIAMTQRRNKYSWGKANAETQIKEIAALQDLDPQLKQIPHSALQQVIQDLDMAYADFLKAKDAFKRHTRDAMPPIPAFKPEGFLYPLYYNAEICTLNSSENQNNLELQLKAQPEAEPLTVAFSTKERPDLSEGLWLLPVEDSQIRVYTASSKEAGRMALNDANSTKGTAISGSSPRG